MVHVVNLWLPKPNGEAIHHWKLVDQLPLRAPSGACCRRLSAGFLRYYFSPRRVKNIEKLFGNPFLQTWKTQVWNVNIWMRSHHPNTLGVEHHQKKHLKVGVMRSHYKRRYFVLGHSRTSSPKTHVIFPRWSLSRSSALCAVLPGGTTKHSCEHACEDEVVSKMLK